MRFNWIEATSTTGGTGALVLSAVTGSPNFDNAFGTSGTRIVRYNAIEFTDSTRTVVVRSEAGFGTITLSTLSLARTRVTASWDGTNLLPRVGSASAAAAVTFGTTAANIRVIVAAEAEEQFPAIPGFVTTGTDNFGALPLNLSVFSASTNTAGITFGVRLWWPVLMPALGPISRVGIRQSALLTGTTATFAFALHEVLTTGAPGNPVFTANTITLSVGGAAASWQSAAIATPVALPTAWYWAQGLFVANGTTGSPTMKAGQMLALGPAGSAMASTPGATLLYTEGTGNTALATGTWTSPAAAANFGNLPLVAFQ